MYVKKKIYHIDTHFIVTYIVKYTFFEMCQKYIFTLKILHFQQFSKPYAEVDKIKID